MVRRWLPWLPLVLLLSACGDDEAPPPSAPGGGGTGGTEPVVCEDDEWQHEEGDCVPIPFHLGCAPGSYELDGSCVPAGVPAELCGEGFAADAAGGCVAIAPDEPCGDGMMAVLGETACQPVGDCGQGTWGAIVTDGDTQFVDGGYGGGGNDGSQSAPWTTIQQGINAALEGAVVAVAAGTYGENLVINAKTVRVWGRCPDMVEVVGSTNPAILFYGTEGGELRGLAVRNEAIAVVIASAQNVALDELWIHDVGFRGLELDTTDGPASATLRRSLIERASDVAVMNFGAELVVEATEVRDTRPAQDDRYGRALAVQFDPDSGLAGSGVVRASILRDNRDVAIYASGSSLTVEDSWIADTQPRLADGAAGVGIGSRSSDGVKATVDVRSTVIERQHQIGAYTLGGDITFDGVVIRDIEPQLSNGEFGRGVSAEIGSTGMRPSLTITRSLVANTRQIGIAMTGGDMEVDKVLVRGVGAQQSNNQFGRAIGIQDDPAAAERGVGFVADSDLRQFAETGVLIVTSDLTLDNLVVSEPTTLTDSVLGDGILLWGDGGSASATIRMVHVDTATRAGVAAFGGNLSLANSWLECNPIDLNGDEVLGLSFSFTNEGGNLCGCEGIATDCKLQSAQLQPPPLPN